MDMDLTDDQIERLLVEAESRLAARDPSKPALVSLQSQAVVATGEMAQSAPGTAPSPAQNQPNQAKDLSVRVPKPVIKEKKVCCIFAPSITPLPYPTLINMMIS